MSKTLKKPNSIPAAIAAIRTIESLGYTYDEAENLWSPPPGKVPTPQPQKNRTEFMSRMGQMAMDGDFWTYQGDGDDHLESLTCPVIIHPQRLLGIVNAASGANVALQRIGSLLNLMPGCDITAAAYPRIRALVDSHKMRTGSAYPFADAGGEPC